MSLKKFLILSTAGLALIAMTSFAGGPAVDVNVAPTLPPPPAVENGFYVEGQLGYGMVNWEDNFNGPDDINFTRNGTGFAFGVDAGYQWNRYVAGEFGWFSLPTVEGKFDNEFGFDLKSWILYGSIKLMAPLMDNLNVFFKAGVGYRSIEGSPAFIAGDNGSVRPMVAGGLEYLWNLAWMVNAQYTYFTSVNNIRAPAVHLFTASVGYFFAM